MLLRVLACLVLSLVLWSAASPIQRVRAAETGIPVAATADSGATTATARTCVRGWLGGGLLQGGAGHCLHATLPRSEAVIGPLPDSRRVAWTESPSPLTQRHIAPSLPPPVSVA